MGTNVIFKLLMQIFVSHLFAYPTHLKVSRDAKYVQVTIKENQGLHLSDSCFVNKVLKCDAISASKTKKELSVTKTGVIGHPASRFCNDNNGAARILLSDDGKQYSYCEFKDGSMIDSWDLYYKRFPLSK